MKFSKAQMQMFAVNNTPHFAEDKATDFRTACQSLHCNLLALYGRNPCLISIKSVKFVWSEVVFVIQRT
jgi:hypothetical protein